MKELTVQVQKGAGSILFYPGSSFHFLCLGPNKHDNKEMRLQLKHNGNIQESIPIQPERLLLPVQFGYLATYI